MLHARQDWSQNDGAEVITFPAQAGEKGDFGRRAPKASFRLIVDLHEEELGPRWFRGAATLAALCSTAIFLMPSFHQYVPVPDKPPTTIRNVPLSELALPQQPIEDATTALPKPVGVQMGVAGNVTRISGDVSGGLYFSLRAAGASPAVATEYLKAISTRLDVGEIAPFDRFDFAVVPGAAGQPHRLIYAGLDRAMNDDVKLLKWGANGKSSWFDGAASTQVSSGLMAPVAGRITSSFGYRFHPILRFSRFQASGGRFSASS